MLMTTGVYSQDLATCGRAFAKSLSKMAKGGFDGFFNDANVTWGPTSHGSVTVRLSVDAERSTSTSMASSSVSASRPR
jgi:hypothetical protein